MSLLIWPVLAFADSVVVFNEVHYHPAEREAELEWVELHNQMAVDVDLSGWYLSDAIFYQFPAGTIVPGGEYIVVALNPQALEAETGFADAFGPFTGRLENSGEKLELRDHNARLMDWVNYRSGDGWPVAADGSGLSLSKVNPDTKSSKTGNWKGSERTGGTPGAVNFENETPAAGGVARGLVSYWNFDGAGAAVGDSGGSNDGTLGSGTRRVAGLIGAGALEFNNTTNALVNVGSGVGNSFSVDSGVTIEALVVPGWSGTAGDYDIIFRKEDGRRRILFGFQNDGNTGTRDVPIEPPAQPVLSFGVNVGGSYRELDMPLDGQEGRPALADLKDGNAHHLAATYQASTGLKAIFVDGVRVFSVELGVGDEIDSGGVATAYIGNMSGRREPFTGQMDEVAFWERALGEAEIAAHHSRFAAGENYFAEPGAEIVEGLAISIHETEVRAGAPGRIEIYNAGARQSLDGFILSSHGAEPGEYVFGELVLNTGEYAVLQEGQLGFNLLPSNRLFLYAPCRCIVADAVRLDEGLKARVAGVGSEWGVPSAGTFGGPNTFDFNRQVVINEIFYRPFSEPAAAGEVLEGEEMIPVEGEWRFDASGAGQEAAWRQLNFNDEAWSSGRGLLYHENSSLPAPKNTELPLGATTYYFRTEFELEADPSRVQLFLRPVIDDGAVFYLNGQELLRLRMPAGEITPATLASSSVGNARYEGPFTVPSAALRNGTNLLAVEVHQRTSGSSDVVFGLELRALVSGPKEEDEEPDGDRETWLELLNTGEESVSLDGWRLSSGVGYEFGEGDSIGPGEHLVIAADRSTFELQHPGVRVLGDFSGRLSG
ncbi:MAG: lamin tail domain-containing protein, partial [Planctomycetota bacterium]|nr:lamin tail domain-containing protein [Planctomycetota bacterium]